jgi:hypothetical protein
MGGKGSGRKRPDSDSDHAVSGKVPVDVYKRLVSMAFRKGATLADLLRRYLPEGLDRDEASLDPVHSSDVNATCVPPPRRRVTEPWHLPPGSVAAESNR